MQRLVETEAEQGADAYTLGALFDDVHRAVWSGTPADPYRRALQRAHVDRQTWMMTEPSLESTDAPALARLDLTRIAASARANAGGGTDLLVQAHLADIAERIATFLEGRPLR
jgi:hypothetical protein